ncbi:MAG TPA: PEP/pyruvate-binding domain-containing protein, partial [Gemmatimonadaceae bacterium]|nr:PEP/pyruvate-binding domain-containing protein [Gemmatimonadaceae bacterium]
MPQSVFFFGNGKAEGTRDMTSVLGGKGANLAEMTSLGVPVPSGFTIACSECIEYLNSGKYSDRLRAEVEGNVARLEKETGRKLGDPRNPLLVSVRSGAPISMPGMMETILNLGLNDRAVLALAEQSKNARFAYDSHRRFIQMYSNVVLGVSIHDFEHLLKAKRMTAGAATDADLGENDLRNLTEEYKALVRNRTGADFPRDPIVQLWGAIEAVWKSWTLKKAKDYRKVNNIPENLGTAVSVVSMVFGNLGDDSGTGVAFTRNPSTGEKRFYGEFLLNAQGEDVVAGIRTPQELTEAARRANSSKTPSLEAAMPEAFAAFREVCRKLERHHRDMLDLEFTIERGKLWMLQARAGKRTTAAALRIAVGLGASPGAATGEVAFTAEEAEKLAADHKDVILVRTETSPEDIHGM